MNKKIKSLHNLIGNTPLIEIEYEFKNQVRKAYFKAEWFNFTGSIKDRMVLSIFENAYENDELKVGQPIVEITSGNTGISLSAIGSILGNPIFAIMPEVVSIERRKIIEAFGSKLYIIGEDQGGQAAREKLRDQLKQKHNAYASLQHQNEYNIKAHFKTTGPEILKQLSSIGKTPSAFVAGVGTSGTLMGTTKFLKQKIKDFKSFAVEPKESPTLKTGTKIGPHKIQGLNSEFISPLYDSEYVDEIIDIQGEDAILMARKLGNELGLGIGISAGSNFLGAVVANSKQNQNAITVSVFPDCNKKYLTSDMYKKVKSEDNFISNKIKLIDFKVIK